MFKRDLGAQVGFKTLPLLFAKLPGSLIISTTFFTLFVFAAITSAIAFVEVVAANFIDLFGWSRKKAVLIVGTACFIFGIPSALSGTDILFANWVKIFGKSFFSTIDDLVSVWFLPTVALMISIYTGWFLDPEISKEEFGAGSNFKWMWKVWIFFLRWLAPAAIILIMLQQSNVINVDMSNSV